MNISSSTVKRYFKKLSPPVDPQRSTRLRRNGPPPPQDKKKHVLALLAKVDPCLPYRLVLGLVVADEVNNRLNRVRALLDAARAIRRKFFGQLLHLHQKRDTTTQLTLSE